MPAGDFYASDRSILETLDQDRMHRLTASWTLLGNHPTDHGHLRNRASTLLLGRTMQRHGESNIIQQNPDGSLSDTTPALQIAADVVGRSCAQWSDIPRVRVDSCRRPACHLATMPKYLIHCHKDPLVPYWDEVGSLSKVRDWWLVVSGCWGCWL